MAKPIVIPALSIDPVDPAPKYQQIRRELTRQIEAGILTPGTRLPGIRKLARLLSVSPDTVKRVFDDLADEGYLKSIPRSGFVVDRLPDVRPVPKTSDPAPFPLGPRHSSETAALAAAALRDYSPRFLEPGTVRRYRDRDGERPGSRLDPAFRAARPDDLASHWVLGPPRVRPSSGDTL